jgi:hypothetical protein
MRSDRVARALLRLYPLEWRERYGDEFLALVTEFGLTWRSSLDILRAATVERVRTLIALARAEADASAPLPEPTPHSGREMILTPLGLAALVGVLVLVGSQFGVAFPRWTFWCQLFIVSQYFDSECRVTRATICERIALTFVWFIFGIGITLAGWLAGIGLLRIGVDPPSDRMLFAIIVLIVVAGIVRLLYRGMASALNKPRPDVTDREMRGWSTAMFSINVLIGMSGPIGEMVWTFGWLASMWLQTTRVRHVRAVRRRQLREQRGF